MTLRKSFRAILLLSVLSIPSVASVLGVSATHLNGTVQLLKVSEKQQAVSFGSHAGFTDAPANLFGKPRTFYPPPPTGVHPRVLFDASGLSALVSRFVANEKVNGSFEQYFFSFTGPSNSMISAFEGLNFDVSNEVLAGYVHSWGKTTQGLSAHMNEASSSALIMMAFHAHVEAARNPMQGQKLFERVTKILGKWAQCLLAHEKLYNSFSTDIVPLPLNKEAWEDEETGLTFQGSSLWQESYTLTQEWSSGIFGMALAYDMIYNEMPLFVGGIEARDVTRRAISRTLRGRISWGMDLDDRRMLSNWATYHSNLWLSALAIEGEAEDENIRNILNQFPRVIKAFMTRAIYPDGSSLEDGYTVNIALREGANALIAGEMRGFQILSSSKFRNIVYHVALMHEPWTCGEYIGGSSGGGMLFTSFYALARNVYPEGKLPNALWRQRMTNDFRGGETPGCRTSYEQTNTQLFHLGMSHIAGTSATPSSLLPLHHFAPVRGLVISKSASSENALYTHFDARGDCAWLGHDNADRGTFTLSAFGKTLVPEMSTWRDWTLSSHHSLLHIDGKAQGLKAACPTMLSVVDDGDMVISSADLTKSYSVQWVPAWTKLSDDSRYRASGYTPETSSPMAYGWFKSTYDAEIGLPSQLWGEGSDNDFGFLGTYIYKKAKLGLESAKVIRSTVTIRDSASPAGNGYMLIVDKATVGDGRSHNYRFQMVLNRDLEIDASRSGPGLIALVDSSGLYLDVHVRSPVGEPSYSIISVPGPAGQEPAKVLVIQTEDSVACEYWVVLHPHLKDDPSGLELEFKGGTLSIRSDVSGMENGFSLDDVGSLVRIRK